MAERPAVAAARSLRAFFTVTISVVIFFSMVSPAAAQKDKKKKKDSTPADTHTTIPMSDEQQIDYNISGMLGAWQVGATNRLHQPYPNDPVFFSGACPPPLSAWPNY